MKKRKTENSKTELSIQQIIIVSIILLVLSFSAGIANSKMRIEVASSKEQELTELESNQEAIQVAQASERDVQTISRESEERVVTETQYQEETEIIAEDVPTYISIEEITVSKDMDLTERCGVSKEDFITLMTDLRTDTSGFFEENSELIYDLCEQYEINEIFFCGLIAGESGWNIVSNHRNTNNYISMMSGGRLIRYSTVEEGLEAAAKLLHNKYLTEGGSCYSGKTLSGVQRRFCPNSSTWVGLIYKCMSQIIK